MPALQADLSRFDASLGAPARNWPRIALVAIAVLALAAAGDWIGAPLRLPLAPEHAQLREAMIGAALLAYVLAMALPFVPGIEIGLALMMLLGEEGILLVYGATQLSLLLSFVLGRWVPTRRVGAAFRWLGLDRAAGLLQRIEAVPPAERAAYLARRAPGRWSAALGRHHGLALAVLLNLPGNALIGGAGGIGMIAGMSRAIPLARYALLVAAATTPVPVFLLLR
jgi:hypothetical protein